MEDTLSDVTNLVMVEDNSETPSFINVGSPVPSLQLVVGKLFDYRLPKTHRPPPNHAPMTAYRLPYI
jgi:hypothetical protein